MSGLAGADCRSTLRPQTSNLLLLHKLRHHEIPRPTPEALAALPRHPVAAVLADVRSIHNVGAMFRTADALRLGHLYLCGYTGTPDNRAIHKTALGAQDTVPWTHHADPLAAIAALRAEGYTIGALEITDAPTPLDALTLGHFPLACIVGNEVTGVDDTLMAQADLALELPQFGAKQSLNVSVAFGVMFYDLVRHYRRLSQTPAP